MPHYAARLSLPHHDVSGVLAMWADKCSAMVVVQHEMDEEVSTTHVHIAMRDCQYATVEPLKRIFRKEIATEAKGNGLWSFKTWDGNQTYLTYMSKGELDPVYLKGYITPTNDWEVIKGAWVTPKVEEKKPNKVVILKAVHDYFANKADKDLFGRPEKGFEKLIPDMDIFSCIRRYLIDNDQPLGLYKVVDLYDAFLMFYDKDRFLYNCRNVLEKRMPRV